VVFASNDEEENQRNYNYRADNDADNDTISRWFRWVVELLPLFWYYSWQFLPRLKW